MLEAGDRIEASLDGRTTARVVDGAEAGPLAVGPAHYGVDACEVVRGREEQCAVDDRGPRIPGYGEAARFARDTLPGISALGKPHDIDLVLRRVVLEVRDVGGVPEEGELRRVAVPDPPVPRPTERLVRLGVVVDREVARVGLAPVPAVRAQVSGADLVDAVSVLFRPGEPR